MRYPSLSTIYLFPVLSSWGLAEGLPSAHIEDCATNPCDFTKGGRGNGEVEPKPYLTSPHLTFPTSPHISDLTSPHLTCEGEGSEGSEGCEGEGETLQHALCRSDLSDPQGLQGA